MLFKKKKEETEQEEPTEEETEVVEASPDTKEKNPEPTEEEKRNYAMLSEFYDSYGQVYKSDIMVNLPEVAVKTEQTNLLFAIYHQNKQIIALLDKISKM